jgi:hypothetical protein
VIDFFSGEKRERWAWEVGEGGRREGLEQGQMFVI